MLTANIAIVAPVTEADDRAAREVVWQQVTERIVPQMGTLCTRFEPSAGAWGQKVSSPYSVILGRNAPALFLYFYASAQRQLDECAKAHFDGFMEHLEFGNEQTVGNTKMCTAYFKGDTAEARGHMEWHIASMFGELMPDCEVLFIGAEGKMEMELVPREGYEIKPLKITNISRGHSLSAMVHNLETLKNVAVSTHEAKKIIRDFKPDAVIGTGGYVCYPVLMAASELHIPTAVHESNAVPGLTTKQLAGHVDRIMLGLEDSKKYYKQQERVGVLHEGLGEKGAGSPGRQAAGRFGLGLSRRGAYERHHGRDHPDAART